MNNVQNLGHPILKLSMSNHQPKKFICSVLYIHAQTSGGDTEGVQRLTELHILELKSNILRYITRILS